MSGGNSNGSENLLCYYKKACTGNQDTTNSNFQHNAAAESNSKVEIQDITEIEEIGRQSTIYPTPPGAKYERRTKIEGKYATEPLIVRRLHPLDEDKPKVHLLIQSHTLREFFRQLPHSNLVLPTHEFPIKIPEPYKGIFHLREEIQQAESDSRASHLNREFSYLKQFQADYMETTIQEVDDLLSSGKISFHYLWALYKPGDLLALQRLDDANKPNFWLVYAQKFSLLERGEEKVWKIEVLSTAIRGDRVGGERGSFEFPAFLGTVEISELPVVPLRYLPDAEKIKADASVRANTYQVLIRPLTDKTVTGRRGTPAHRHYKGPVWVPTKDTSRNRLDQFMWEFGRKKDQEGCRFFDSASFNVESDVIIDPDLFIKEEPQFMVDMLHSTAATATTSSASASTPGLTEDQLLTLPPWIPAFCLSINKWGFVLVGDWLQQVQWEPNAITQLEIADTTKEQLLRLVEGLVTLGAVPASNHQVINGKGQGLNILLHGDPGVGKTTTAECVAQALRRPLYRLNGGDLGTKASELEAALEKALQWSKAWQAVMLIDEADAFMMKRDEADIIEQKAMVSSILRKLEYQQGVVFMTTNRHDSIDSAILSRMHIKIRYSALTKAARTKIWRSHLGKAGHSLSANQIGSLGELGLDGRAIANIAYLASLIAGGDVVCWDHIQQCISLETCHK